MARKSKPRTFPQIAAIMRQYICAADVPDGAKPVKFVRTGADHSGGPYGVLFSDGHWTALGADGYQSIDGVIAGFNNRARTFALTASGLGLLSADEAKGFRESLETKCKALEQADATERAVQYLTERGYAVTKRGK